MTQKDKISIFVLLAGLHKTYPELQIAQKFEMPIP